MAKRKGSKKTANPGKAPKREPTLRELQRSIERLEARNVKLREELARASAQSREQKREIAKLQGKMDTRTRREDMMMGALEFNSRSKKGDKGAIGRITQSLVTADDHILKMGKRMENMLSALKNHREYLIRLNKKVYKAEPMKRAEMELGIMNNTLSIMALSGYGIDRALFGDIKGIRKMMAKEDADIAKVQKRMSGFKKKFDEELEKFDLESIFRKSEHLPGYR